MQLEDALANSTPKVTSVAATDLAYIYPVAGHPGPPVVITVGNLLESAVAALPTTAGASGTLWLNANVVTYVP